MAKNDSKLVTKVSPLIEGQVPDFVQADHPVFVSFLKDLPNFSIFSIILGGTVIISQFNSFACR